MPCPYWVRYTRPRMRTIALFSAALAAALSFSRSLQPAAHTPQAPQPEPRLADVRQLTFGGENAEAYFSPDGKQLIFQSTRGSLQCDQIFTMSIEGGEPARTSTGKGRTTCAYFYPDGKSVLYASTHERSEACPPRPTYERGYVWPVYESYEIYRARSDGSGLTPLTRSPGYDAEATIGADGRIVFTSVRDGDMEVYSMHGDGSDVRRLTSRPGPDGGPFLSPDGRSIVFRGRAIEAPNELEDYQSLLKRGLWRPTQLEILVMDRDGKNFREVTRLKAASFAPSWHPDGKRIIFSSNAHDPRGRNFDLYLINVDGTGLERITFENTFDGFPMFSPDGRLLVFASNRRAAREGDTNLFRARWVD
jgi:TolB protein